MREIINVLYRDKHGMERKGVVDVDSLFAISRVYRVCKIANYAIVSLYIIVISYVENITLVSRIPTHIAWYYSRRCQVTSAWLVR
jgi:hypothetical protein